MKKLAVCIPTYNRSDVIEEFLMMCLEMYQSYGIDIYIYDSSEDDLTKNVVSSYQSKSEHLYYRHMDSKIHSNMKVYMIFQEFQQKQEYEYIWICGDSLRWVEKVIKEICALLEEKYDLLIVNQHDVEKIGSRVYTDANELFLDCAWHMTLYGATIVRIESVFKNIQWDKMMQRYMVYDKINFSHLAMYFEQLCIMPSIKVFHLSIPRKDMIASLKKTAAGWREETFLVWGTYWPNTIKSLPDFYKHKAKVIKKHGEYSGILSLESIIWLRSQGIYNFDIFLKYFFQWHSLVYIPIWKLFVIAVLSEERASFIYEVKLKEKRDKKTKKQMKKFCKKYEDIYIYGCGKRANRYANYLEQMNINYKSFWVSNIENIENKIVRNHTVEQFSESLIDEKNQGILMGINEINYYQLIKQFPMLDNLSNVFKED